MPRLRSLTQTCVDLLVFVSMFALMGHLSMNYWERFIIEKELANVKSSLYSLKKTINQIGYAYDGLHRQLTSLAEKSEWNTPPPIPSNSDDKPIENNMHQSLDKTTINDVEAIVYGMDHTTSTKPLISNKAAQIFILKDNKNKTTQFTPPERTKVTKIVSTMTKNPVKSTAVGIERNIGESYDKVITECCKDCQPECQTNFENLRF